MDYEQWFKYPKYLRLIWAGILRRLGNKVSSCIEFNTIDDWVFERQSPLWHSKIKELMPDANHSFFTKQLYNSQLRKNIQRFIIVVKKKMNSMDIYKESY